MCIVLNNVYLAHKPNFWFSFFISIFSSLLLSVELLYNSFFPFLSSHQSVRPFQRMTFSNAVWQMYAKFFHNNKNSQDWTRILGNVEFFDFLRKSIYRSTLDQVFNGNRLSIFNVIANDLQVVFNEIKTGLKNHLISCNYTIINRRLNDGNWKSGWKQKANLRAFYC